jgi:hypothetical protein
MPVEASREARNLLRKIREYHNRAEKRIEAYFERQERMRLSFGPKDPSEPSGQ